MNSFLQDLVDELSNESNTDISAQYLELLDYTIESDCNHINQTLGFMATIQANFESHFSNGDASFENYQSYEQTTRMILNSTGISVPIEILVPSFEASSVDTSGEKKDGVLAKAWDWVKRMFTNLWNWVTRKGDAERVKSKVELEKVEMAIKGLNDLIPKLDPTIKVKIKATKWATRGGELDLNSAGERIIALTSNLKRVYMKDGPATFLMEGLTDVEKDLKELVENFELVDHELSVGDIKKLLTGVTFNGTKESMEKGHEGLKKLNKELTKLMKKKPVENTEELNEVKTDIKYLQVSIAIGNTAFTDTYNEINIFNRLYAEVKKHSKEEKK